MLPARRHLSQEQPMTTATPGDITRNLNGWAAGDAEALARVYELGHREIRAVAANILRQAQHPGVGTDTAVQGAAERLFKNHPTDFVDRRHFFNTFGQSVRQFVSNRARHEGKRHEIHNGESYDPEVHGGDALLSPLHALALDQAFSSMTKLHGEEFVNDFLKWNAGKTVRELAAETGASERTLRDRLKRARTLLRHKIQGLGM